MAVETINQKYERQRTEQLQVAELAMREAEQAKNIVVNHTVVRPIMRQSQDIQKWRNALAQAEQDQQQRQWLYDLYSEVLLDGRLKALIEQRVQRITNTPLSFGASGKVNDQVTTLTKRGFFRKFLREALMARFWGHSLLELYWPAPDSGATGVTNLINRKHVKPRKGVVTRNAYDIDGLPYREAPYNQYCIEVGDCEDLGILLECCPNVIYKRGGFGDWAEFAEVFGMPFRWATYNNEQSRGILEDALSKAGAAGYVVAPADAQLQFFNPTAGGQSNDIFRFLIEQCNQELAITVLGNTMTTAEAKHSGYAQSETHWKTQDEVHQDDRAFVLCVLNEMLTPYLASIGYKVKKGAEWAFQDGDGLTLPQRLEVDLKVATKVPISPDYWYDKYQLPKPKPGELPDEEPGEETDQENEPGEGGEGQRPGKP